MCNRQRGSLSTVRAIRHDVCQLDLPVEIEASVAPMPRSTKVNASALSSVCIDISTGDNGLEKDLFNHNDSALPPLSSTIATPSPNSLLTTVIESPSPDLGLFGPFFLGGPTHPSLRLFKLSCLPIRISGPDKLLVGMDGSLICGEDDDDDGKDEDLSGRRG